MPPFSSPSEYFHLYQEVYAWVLNAWALAYYVKCVDNLHVVRLIYNLADLGQITATSTINVERVLSQEAYAKLSLAL